METGNHSPEEITRQIQPNQPKKSDGGFVINKLGSEEITKVPGIRPGKKKEAQPETPPETPKKSEVGWPPPYQDSGYVTHPLSDETMKDPTEIAESEKLRKKQQIIFKTYLKILEDPDSALSRAIMDKMGIPDELRYKTKEEIIDKFGIEKWNELLTLENNVGDLARAMETEHTTMESHIPDLSNHAEIIGDKTLDENLMETSDEIVRQCEAGAKNLQEFNEAIKDIRELSKEIINDPETKVWNRLQHIIEKSQRQYEIAYNQQIGAENVIKLLEEKQGRIFEQKERAKIVRKALEEFSKTDLV